MKNNRKLLKSFAALSLLGVSSLISCGEDSTSKSLQMDSNSISTSLDSSSSSQSSSTSSNSIDKATEVAALIAKLNESSTEEEVAAARDAYDQLSEEDKTKIDESSLNKLIDLETKIDDKKRARHVIELIDSLTELSTEEEISEVQKAYDDLSEQAKGYVTNLDKFNNVKQALVDTKSANDVIGLIDDISNKEDDALLFASQKEKIQLARSSYDSLSDNAKTKVSNYSSLVNYETRISYYSKLLIDSVGSIATRGDSKEYTYPIEVGSAKDEDYGDTFELTLNVGSAYKKIEIYLNGSLDANSLGAYEKVFFYFYSPQETALNLTFGNTAWNYLSLPSGNVIKGWNKIEANVSDIISGATSGTINTITSEWEQFDAKESSGWKITPIYGMRKKTSDVISNILDALPDSIETNTTFEKIEYISRLAYGEKLFNEKLNENEKSIFDKTKMDELLSNYSNVGKVAYGLDETQVITSEDGSFANAEFDSSSSFTSLFGQGYKISFTEKAPMQVHWMDIAGSIDTTGYTKLAVAAFNDLDAWGNASSYADKLLFANGDPWFSLQQGIPGYMEDDGLGKGVGVLEGIMDFSSGAKTLSSAKIGFQNTWDVTSKTTLCLSPIVILK